MQFYYSFLKSITYIIYLILRKMDQIPNVVGYFCDHLQRKKHTHHTHTHKRR